MQRDICALGLVNIPSDHRVSNSPSHHTSTFITSSRCKCRQNISDIISVPDLAGSKLDGYGHMIVLLTSESFTSPGQQDYYMAHAQSLPEVGPKKSWGFCLNKSWDIENYARKDENFSSKFSLAFLAPEHNFIYYSNLFILIQEKIF